MSPWAATADRRSSPDRKRTVSLAVSRQTGWLPDDSRSLFP
ncbi:MAG: hypothetical protein AAF283_11290 [Cyanobacteria bacterium P01_A01_bin.70]